MRFTGGSCSRCGSEGAWGLGVWHRVLFRDLLARAEWSLGLRVTTRFRLRWLSERGRLDCAGNGLSRMLKWVPVWGGEGWWWPGYGWCSCPVAGLVTLPDMSCRSGLQAAIGVEPSAPGDASYENLETEAAFFGRRPRRAARSRKPPGAGCRSSAADRATQSTHHPELEPSSASSDDHNDLDRDNPAPIAIEAGIPSSPAKHAAHDARARRSSTDAAIKHLTTDPIDPHRNSLLPVKSAFAYFSGACEK